jgi:uncharacterized repeat protein (TIGR03803 family)
VFQTKVTEMSTLAGFVPAGRPNNAHQPRRRVAAVTPRVSAAWLACALATMGIGSAQAQTATETVLHSFGGSPPAGGNPSTGLIRDSAGNLYGTTGTGGIANAGVVYKLSAAGQQTILHNFTGGDDGNSPGSGVVADKAGNLYGTTVNGGTAGRGVVFKLNKAGHETVLYNFTGGADGGSPYGGLLIDPACKSPCVLYGTTQSGGTSNAGVVYKLDTNGSETVLYTFTGGADGGGPYAGVISDPAGNLYGTTFAGGASGQGVVYKLDPAGTETVLHTFTGLTDGGGPNAGVIRDPDGNLYGTTTNGLNSTLGCSIECGVVYKLDTSGQETVLYTFIPPYDAYWPLAGVIRDAAGNLYGTTAHGGANNSGTVYKVDPAGNETLLYSFNYLAGGYSPGAGVIGDGAGNLYGTAYFGGPLGLGAVYKLDAAGTETVLCGFQNPVGGSSPQAGVVGDSGGNLYGTTSNGGTSGAGVVYKLDPTRHETVLYAFTGGTDGGNPYGGVILDSAGNIYGTTVSGGIAQGSAGYGVVFKLDPAGQETVLYTFTGGADGAYPVAGVVRDSAGNLYGTTECGGSGQGCAGAGVVFELNAAGKETVLYTFTGGADGGYPAAGVIRDSAGKLYGTGSGGGTSGAGVVFKLDPAGQETVLYTFTGGADGGYPYAGLIFDSAGNLYGTGNGGGTSGYGVVFKVNTAGQETVLYTFTGGADGGYPHAGLISAPGGHLFGTTYSGGKEGSGVVFELKVQ